MIKNLNIIAIISFICLLILFYLTKKPPKKRTISNIKTISYHEDFFNPAEFQIIKEHSKDLKNEVSLDRFNPNRFGIQVKEGPIYNIITSKKFGNKIRKIIGNEYYLASFPVEYRIYPEGSQGMAWHKDVLIYKEPQYEFVFTIENESDSFTEWIEDNDKKVSQKTSPNSLIAVKALTNLHRVTPINKGFRTILKFIFTKTEEKEKIYDFDKNCRYNDCQI